MSDIQASSIASTSGGLSAAGGTTNIRLPSNTGGESAGAGASQSVAASRTETTTSQTFAASSSSQTLNVEQSGKDDMLAMLVTLLIQFLLGDKEDDKKDQSDMLAGLVGMMALSSSQNSSDRFSYFESQTSQLSQSVTTTNTSAVQASSYGQATGGAEGGTASLGGQLDVTG